MTLKRSAPADAVQRERRSGLNRRWIKTPYGGPERRSGKDRRGVPPAPESGKPGESAADRTEALEKLLLTTTVRLEALARLLVSKGLLSHAELSEMLQTLQAEYQQQLKENG
jgi:hypothetical protein